MTGSGEPCSVCGAAVWARTAVRRASSYGWESDGDHPENRPLPRMGHGVDLPKGGATSGFPWPWDLRASPKAGPESPSGPPGPRPSQLGLNTWASSLASPRTLGQQPHLRLSHPPPQNSSVLTAQPASPVPLTHTYTWPVSWATTKAEEKPSSWLRVQLLRGWHMPVTGAYPAGERERGQREVTGKRVRTQRDLGPASHYRDM